MSNFRIAAMIVADQLSTMDAFQLQQIAEMLVRRNQTKADILEHAISVSQREKDAA